MMARRVCQVVLVLAFFGLLGGAHAEVASPIQVSTYSFDAPPPGSPALGSKGEIYIFLRDSASSAVVAGAPVVAREVIFFSTVSGSGTGEFDRLPTLGLVIRR